nr:hypothetical protein 6 [bacterium]
MTNGKEDKIKYTPPEPKVAPTISYPDEVADIARSVVNAEAFKYFKIVFGALLFTVLGFLASQVIEIKGYFRYVEKIDNFYEVKAQNERLIREISQMKEEIKVLRNRKQVQKKADKNGR